MVDPISLAVGAILAAAVALFVGLCFGLSVVRQAESQLKEPIERRYTILIARFPDPLILQFGYERGLLDLPNGLRLAFVAWGEGLRSLLADGSRIAYTNRRTTVPNDRKSRITLREEVLCKYKGFSICVFPTDREHLPHFDTGDAEATLTHLGHYLKDRKLLARRDTDQHRALIELFARLGIKDTTNNIDEIGPEDDLLECALRARTTPQPAVIGFAGGITERLAAEKIGYVTIAEQPTILADIEEANSFAYLRPQNSQAAQELTYMLDQAEALWRESVRQILSDVSVKEDFQRFLNEELRGKLGPLASEALNASHKELVTDKDMALLLGRWLQFSAPDA